MKTSTAKSRVGVPGKPAAGWLGRAVFCIALLFVLAALPLAAEPVDFHQAIESALKHSGAIMAAQAERNRTIRRYQAERDAYYPTVVFGSGIGFSLGQPIAIAGQAPSIFNITHDQTLWNPAARESIRAAKSDSIAADVDYTDKSEQVILDTALIYIELNSTEQRLNTARQQKEATDHAFYIAQQREKEGVGSAIETKRAELDAARVDLRITELETSADTLRQRLAIAMGEPTANISTVTDSIPAPPELESEQDTSEIALANSAAVQVADQRARAAHQRARSQHLMNHPSIDFAGQYAMLSKFNNYDAYYKRFTRNNYSFGLNIRIPIFNLSQNAAAAAADAEALKADADAQIMRDQVAADAVRAQHTVRQLQAQARVSRLELEVAQANVDAIKLETEEGRAGARDQALAQADIANRQVLLQQSQFEFLRAQLQLLRETGSLHDWALGESGK